MTVRRACTAASTVAVATALLASLGGPAVAHAQRLFPWELPGPPKGAAVLGLTTSDGTGVAVEGWGRRVKLVVTTPSSGVAGKASIGVVEYLGQGEATKAGIEASFGDLGEVSVRFEPRRRIHRGSLPFAIARPGGGCGTQWGPAKVGVFVGRIDLRGEGDFFGVDAHRAKGLVGRVPRSGCSEPVPGDLFGPGECKELGNELGAGAAGVVSRSVLPSRKVFFLADRGELTTTKQSKTTNIRFGLFVAGKFEEVEPLTISRSVIGVGPPAAIAADSSHGSLTITPPQFGGTGIFQSSLDGSLESSGSLTVAFPGDPEATALVGPTFEGRVCVPRTG